VTPLLLIALLVASLALPEEVSEETKALVGKTTFATVAGWLVLLSGLVFVPIQFFACLYRSGWDLSYIMKPSKKWGPYLKKHRVGTRYEKSRDDQNDISEKQLVATAEATGQANEGFS